MYVHTGTWPYRCTICTRGFSKQTNLKNHLQLHENGGLEAETVPGDVEEEEEDGEEEEEDEEEGEGDIKDKEHIEGDMARVPIGPLSDFLLQMVQSARGGSVTAGAVVPPPVSSGDSEVPKLEFESDSTATRIKSGLSNLFRPINM
jgi:Zinc finger, C2H2 type